MDDAVVLLVEDDPEVRMGIAQALQLAGLEVAEFGGAEAALDTLRRGRRAVLVTDVRLPGIDGLELLARVRAIDPELPVIVITGHGDVQMAVEAMRAGAADFLEKPFSSERMAQLARQALLARCAWLDALALGEAPQRLESRLIGRSAAMRELRDRVLALAGVEATVLIHGETGSGKEMAARALHDAGPRRDAPFVALNCAGLPETLFDSEIFGHEPGAFTGAAGRRIGRLEHAAGGTLFLDEIETMPLPQQAKLLRVLQERSFERLGSNQSRPLQCRVLAATKADLKTLARQGGFREDLYYRLAVVELRLPPLRERLDDVPLLFQSFVLAASAAAGREPAALPGGFLLDLMTRSWEGNVRELRNAAERYVLGMPAADEPRPGDPEPGLDARVAAFERQLLLQALRRAGGRVSVAAAEAALPRKTFYDKMRRHAIRREEYGGEESD